MNVKRTILAVILFALIVLTICACGDSESTTSENVENTTAATTEATATTTEATTAITEATTAQPTTVPDKYGDSKKYLSDFEEIDGGGLQVSVDKDLDGDFIALKNCAMYSLKKGYETIGSMDMGVFGYFDGDIVHPAFTFDGVYNYEITVFDYESYASPPGWQWVLSSDDIKYIEGEN